MFKVGLRNSFVLVVYTVSISTPKPSEWHHFGVSTANVEHIKYVSALF